MRTPAAISYGGTMKLYDSRRAPNPRRVRWVMAEKGIEDVEIIDIDIFKGSHKEPEFRAKFGLSNIPALELDDGTGITESVAIARYLESLYRSRTCSGAIRGDRGDRDVDAADGDEPGHALHDRRCASATRRWPRSRRPTRPSRSAAPAGARLPEGAGSAPGRERVHRGERITIADILAYTAWTSPGW
jgi:glutathione S-transferase